MNNNFKISQSGSSADLFTKTDSLPGNLASQNGEYHEYDSGNDTSSPPSTQTSSSRSKDSQEKRSLVHDGFGHAFSSGKPKLANSDNSSDSGNSFTSCFSQTKGTALENLSPDAQGQDRSEPNLACPFPAPSGLVLGDKVASPVGGEHREGQVPHWLQDNTATALCAGAMGHQGRGQESNHHLVPQVIIRRGE
ncbi:hypothetical protein QYF61_026496 [Mycteria americana]|uniref:Uncharacterized protein n=1 Tax=Mycteria americana TaxID=33587 RepID=A0AAN7RZT7_MYCAM|nr:hypothetical protein QYF61_026496 [Mycteria americana]